ncbi:hypothetical protein QJS10_CPA05g00877 [Acorus calamus]|uniref:Uncharacterized protein n=1 Tax=Acorus calamus TaxID=4465 RepID=A0AAV9EYE2_ACOCL|nr:hypothetical protein QJS10_CPA05g00877 [Acorus calamus]
MPMASLLLLLLVLLVIPLSVLLALRLLVRPCAINIPIRGRHVFISGGSSGIGLSLAHQAASAGASRVTILARSVAKLEDARDSIRRATGADVSAFSADVRDFDAVKKAVDAAGPVDVLICNHGVFVAQDFETQDLEVAKFMVDVNLMGTINLIRAALPAMKQSRPQRGPGSIAIMSSQAGQVGLHGYAAYSVRHCSRNSSRMGFMFLLYFRRTRRPPAWLKKRREDQRLPVS